MARKKNVQITVELNSKDALEPYLQPTYGKVVVINAFHPFWGRCDVAESMLKKFMEEPANNNKVDFISIPYEFVSDIIPKDQFGSKPKYFIFVKGELITSIPGIDFPRLKKEINAGYAKFEEVTL